MAADLFGLPKFDNDDEAAKLIGNETRHQNAALLEKLGDDARHFENAAVTAVGRPLRRLEMSTTSSCSSVAV